MSMTLNMSQYEPYLQREEPVPNRQYVYTPRTRLFPDDHYMLCNVRSRDIFANITPPTISPRLQQNVTTVDLFFEQLTKILESNNREAACQIARRITYGLPEIIENCKVTEVTEDGKKVTKENYFQLPTFHQKLIAYLNKSNTPAAAAMRQELAPFYFLSAGNRRLDNFCWLSEKEMESISSSKYSQAYYYHATSSLKNFEAIMRTQKVKAQTAAFGFGAFVNMQNPAFKYGEIVLAFNKNIERISPLSTWCHIDTNTFAEDATHNRAIAFSKDIPVNSETLSYVILRGSEDCLEQAKAEGIVNDGNLFQPRNWLQKKCKEWTGTDISVLTVKEAEYFQEIVKKMNLGIPKEWGRPGYSSLTQSKNLPVQTSVFLPSRM